MKKVGWHKGQRTYPCAVRRVVMHDDLRLSIFESIPHNPTMIITYTRIQNSSAKVIFFSHKKQKKTKRAEEGRVRQGTGPTH